MTPETSLFYHRSTFLFIATCGLGLMISGADAVFNIYPRLKRLEESEKPASVKTDAPAH